MKKIELVSKLVAIGAGILYLAFFQENLWLIYAVFVIVMLTVGISHGAIDHLLYNPAMRGQALAKFITKYLAIMAVYLALWLFSPIVGLLAFILMSSYHFGQSHFLNHIQGKFPKTVYISTGLFFLLLILSADYAETSKIIGTIVDIGPYKSYFIGGVFLSGAAMLLSGWINYGRTFTKTLIEIFILSILLSQLPLLLGFAIYFGFWHALPSMLVEFDALKGNLGSQKFKNFILQLLPFTCISIFGISILLVLLLNRVSSEQLVFIFFVMISLISAPHIWYMDKFLMTKNQN